MLNNCIKSAKRSASTGLRFGSLDLKTTHLRVYRDTSFAKYDELSSQLMVFILLCEGHNSCQVIDYRNHKSRRVVHSVMGGEVVAFIDGFDHAFAFVSDLEMLQRRRLSVFMYMDSKQLFDSMARGKHTSESRQIIEIMAARQAYRRLEIAGVALVRRDVNPADGLSKTNASGAL